MMTGEQYRESLRDGRRVFVEGVEVSDVTTAQVLRRGADNAAASYDAYFRPGAVSGPYFEVATNVAEMKAQLDDLLQWDFLTVVTSQGLLALLTAAARMRPRYPEYADRIEAYFEYCKMNDLRAVQAITDAKGNRNLPPGKQDDPDFYTRIVEHRPDGIVINGAKLHISSAPVAHELIVMPTKMMKPGEEEWAVCCAVPVNAEGVRIVGTTYAPRGEDERYYPRSGRVNNAEGFVIFDHVFVPNERVFLAGEIEHSATLAHALGLWERLGGTAHLAETGDMLVGLAQLIAEANGVARIPHIRDKIAEMVIYATLVRAGLEAAIANAKRTPEGWMYPDELFTNAAKHYGAAEYSLMCRHLHDIAGGSVLTAPTPRDVENSELEPYISKYMRTMDGVDAGYRMRLFHTIRDLTADTYGGWQLVTMIQSGGGLYAQRLVAAKHYDIDRAKSLALHEAGLA